MTTDLNKLQEYLSQKNFPAAGALIREALAEPVTSEERGKALADFATMYLDLMNETNANYAAALTEAVKGLEALKTAEARTDDTVRASEIRQSLRNQ